MESLSDKLSSLGIRKASNIEKPIKDLKPSLAELLNAQEQNNNFGHYLLVKNIYSYGYKHGKVPFINLENTSEINKTGKSFIQEGSFRRLVFVDTETTGLAGGTGTFAFLVGIGFFTNEGFELQQFIMEKPTDEKALLLALSHLLEQFVGVVTFNGKSFDIPLLRTRFLLNQIPHPLENLGHLDLLHLSRRIWKKRLPSRTLQDLEREILELPRTDDDVPGWMIPEIYFNFLRNGDGSVLKNVIYHNGMDIVSLAALFIRIQQILEDELFTDEVDVLDLFSIGEIYESLGDLKLAIRIYEYCNTIKAQEVILDGLDSRLSTLYKKNNNFDNAIEIWEKLANDGDFSSCVELAKYFEHNQKDNIKAIKWTMKAIEVTQSDISIPRHTKKSRLTELEKRCNRLERR